jgi:hypothetical protein
LEGGVAVLHCHCQGLLVECFFSEKCFLSR